MAVGSGVQWSSPVAWRSEPIRLPCGGGTGLSGGSPQLSSAAAVMTSAAGELAEPASAELGAGGSGRPVGEPSPQLVAKTIVARDSPTTTQRLSFTRYQAMA